MQSQQMKHSLVYWNTEMEVLKVKNTVSHGHVNVCRHMAEYYFFSPVEWTGLGIK